MMSSGCIADEREISVIGGCMLDGTAADEALAIVRPTDFQHVEHRIIFGAIAALRAEGLEPDLRAVADHLREQGKLDQAGGGEYLATIDQIVPTAANTAHFARLMDEDAAFRELRRALDTGGNRRAAFQTAARRLDRLESRSGAASEPRTLAAILADPTVAGPPELVVPRLVWAGRVSMLAAREKVGKSTLASAAVAAVSAGQTFLDEHVKRELALVVGLDEHLGDSARRLVRFGADVENVLLLDRLDGRNPMDTLARVVGERIPALVVVDALANVGALAGVQDAASSASWTPILARIARFARDTGAGVLLLHHARKSDGLYRDSSAIGAGVDAIFEMSEGTGTGIRDIRGRARWAVEDFSVRLTGDLRDDDAALSFDLTAGELSLDARILLFVESRPGCSARQVRIGVTGSNVAIDRAVAGLIERGAIEDRGDGQGRALHATGGWGRGAVPGAVPDETAPSANPYGHWPGAVRARSGGTDRALSPNPRGAVLGTVREETL